MKNSRLSIILAFFELALMVLAVLSDFFLPTLTVSAIGTCFILLRKERFTELGFKKPDRFLKKLLAVFILSLVWTTVDYGLILPVLNHLTGETQNLSAFTNLKGNVGETLLMLGLSWTLAAVGEELAYRGFMQHRIIGLFKSRAVGITAAVVLSSLLFGFAHTEQSIIGIVITAADALFFSVIRYRYDNIWSSVLAHGFMNSIGIITFFFTGPIYGLW
jgi:membrane protease YdiL (CAAX protease family)